MDLDQDGYFWLFHLLQNSKSRLSIFALYSFIDFISRFLFLPALADVPDQLILLGTTVHPALHIYLFSDPCSHRAQELRVTSQSVSDAQARATAAEEELARRPVGESEPRIDTTKVDALTAQLADETQAHEASRKELEQKTIELEVLRQLRAADGKATELLNSEVPTQGLEPPLQRWRTV